MSGEKKLRTDKANEIWYRLLLDENFEHDLIKLKKNSYESSYYIRQYFLFKKYGIIPSQRLRNFCDRYTFGKKYAKILGDHFAFRIQTPSELELKESRRAFIKLWIYDGISRDETVDYVKKTWNDIKRLLRLQNTERIKRIRRVENKQVIKLVLTFNSLSTEELRCLTNEDGHRGIYREILIRRLLLREGYNVTIEAVKDIIIRYKNQSKNT